MADRVIVNIAQNWLALTEEEQDARVSEWLQRNHIPAIAENLLNQMYEDDDADENDDDDSTDDSEMDSDIDDSADDNSNDDDNADDDSDDDDNADDDSDDDDSGDYYNVDDDSDAGSDSTLQADMDVEIEDEPFDFFKFDYSYDRHNGPPYVEEEEFDYCDDYADTYINYDSLDEPDYEEFIDR